MRDVFDVVERFVDFQQGAAGVPEDIFDVFTPEAFEENFRSVQYLACCMHSFHCWLKFQISHETGFLSTAPVFADVTSFEYLAR